MVAIFDIMKIILQINNNNIHSRYILDIYLIKYIIILENNK